MQIKVILQGAVLFAPSPKRQHGKNSKNFVNCAKMQIKAIKMIRAFSVWKKVRKVVWGKKVL